MSKITPMMQQYLDIKARYPDILLLYRMGDFYELFFEDAEVAAPLLDIALTTRGRHLEKPIPMCGVPCHSADNYISRLVKAGRKVAVCDQMEDPASARGLVKRDVVRVITPGLVLESQNLAADRPNYMAAVRRGENGFGLAYLDVSTGEFKAVELESEGELSEELYRIAPREVLLPSDEELLEGWVRKRFEASVTRLDSPFWHEGRAEEKLIRHFKVHSLEGFGLGGMGAAVGAAGVALEYAEAHLFSSCAHVQSLLPYRRGDYMILDEATLRNLEIFYSTAFQGRKGSLVEVVDETRTAMGGRALQRWLRFPLVDLRRIVERQEAVAQWIERSVSRAEARGHLGKVHDLERLVSRITVGTANPRDLLALRKSLEALPLLEGCLTVFSAPLIREIRESWDNLEDVLLRLRTFLADDPPAQLNAGGVIRPEAHAELEECVRLSRNAKEWLAEYQARQREETGIGSLKVRYNKVFGYYIEISNANLKAAPSHYVRKQTLVNAERFVTEELKELESKILEAEEKRSRLEEELFFSLRRAVADEGSRIQAMARHIARLDCLAGLAEAAALGSYCRPLLDEGDSIRIVDGRHPVIERFLDEGSFVPNDLEMDSQSRQVLVITGPNMAGKSTILRQTALIVLMAHTGGFVPAREARMGLVDRIFTRVGASDDLVRGRSTFMVEMQETAYILHQASPRSFVVLDEIGRGTSTFDGVSIAWAVAEALHDHEGRGIKTLFATHYHELTELAGTRPRVRNFNVAMKEQDNEILFFHKLLPGATNKSYGVQVARLAGLPPSVTDRAREILDELQNGGSGFAKRAPRSARSRRSPHQLNLFRSGPDELEKRVRALKPDEMTPLEALKTLYALKEQLQNEGKKR